MHRKILVLLFILSIAYPYSQNSNAQGQAPAKPKLVIGIVVDQMRSDYIYRYWDKLGSKGLKRLVSEGFECKNAQYNYMPTYTGPGHACIYTGTTPSINGIISNLWYVRESNDTMYVVADKSVSAVGGAEAAGKMSPKNLLTTTITDELRLASGFNSKVIGISLKDRGAILPAGHSANAAYWFDAATGNWITSTYYMNDLPGWVKNFNNRKLPASYLSQPWTTLLPIAQYTESTTDSNAYEELYPNETKPVFPHDFPKIKGNNFELVRRSPFGNTLTKELAIEAIKSEKLGTGSFTDFLAVSFSATDYVGHQFGTNSIETEDTYLRLDKDIEDLLTFIDQQIGKNNALIFLTADHAALPNPGYLRAHQVPAGYFSADTVKDSLNKFMKAEYGEGRWVLCFDNDQVFLNRELIRERKLDLEQVQEHVAAFLIKFKGIANTVTASALDKTEFIHAPRSLLQNGYNQKRSGDVMIILEPGLIEWMQTGTTHGSPYNYDTHVPLLWYGWKIQQGSTSDLVNVVDIAPTLSVLLNIDFPSGCTGKPIKPGQAREIIGK